MNIFLKPVVLLYEYIMNGLCCIILCILHHEWIVTVVVTFVQIRHPAGRRRSGSRRHRTSRRRPERRRVSTRLNIIFLKPVVLLYEYIMNGLCCIILCILHHEWIVTVVVTFVQIRHPAGRRRSGSRRHRTSRRRPERRRVSTRLNIIFLKPVVLLYEYIMNGLCCIILCILHHEWIVTVVVTFVQIRHPAGRRRSGSRRRRTSRRRPERRRVSTRLNIIFLKPVVLLYEYINYEWFVIVMITTTLFGRL